MNEVRRRRLLEQPLECIYHASVDDSSAETAILAPMPDLEAYEQQRQKMHAPKDAPPELASLYEMPLLNKEQEQHLFRQMNYLKYKASKVRGRLDPTRARIQELKQIEDLQAQATAVKDK